MAESIIPDPDLFKNQAIDPETEAFNKKIEAFISRMPPMYTKTPQELRHERGSEEDWMGPIKVLDEAEDRVVPGRDHDVAVRVVVPDEVRGVYLHMHGGGFVLMRASHFDEALVATAKNCKVAVVSVDYRLAPENPYPAAADDCETVAAWLAENAGKEFGSDNIIVGGESAGANLAAVTMVRMRDRHDYTGFRGANLVFGCYDISMTPSQRNWGERDLLISTPMIEYFNSHYVPEVEKRRDPDVSPLYADLRDMPPSLFTVGTLDPLLDDTLFMHARWLAAGNTSELAVYPGGTHIFTAFPIKIAKQANKRIFEFISKKAAGSL